MKKYIIPYILIIIVGFTSCDKNNNFNIFSVQDDVALGQQVSEEIAGDPQFDILSETEYPFAYQYLNNMTNEILSSDDIAYKEEFAWEVKIVRNDTVLNAFATPGGYIYIYTGLIKYLDNADAFAGVLGHEIAHADLRHTSRNLQKQYGVSVLLSIVFGKETSQVETIAGQIAGTLAGLRFSREYESEADDNSVLYLADTKYACNGAGFFFEKINAAGEGAQVPEFLSTHPNPANRIEDINSKADELNCETSFASNTRYQEFKNSLPD